jgi:hypothetical protein
VVRHPLVARIVDAYDAPARPRGDDDGDTAPAPRARAARRVAPRA